MDNDLIRRGSVTDFLKIWYKIPTYNWGEKNVIGGAIQTVENIPAVDARPNEHGKWETNSDNLPVCSKCGEIALQRIFVKVPHLIMQPQMVLSNFCPYCGVSMRG